MKHAKKSLFLIVFNNKNIEFLGHKSLTFFCKELNKYLNLNRVLIGKFFGPYQYVKFSLINSVR